MNGITEMQITQRVISWEGKGENGGKVQGLRSTTWQVQNRQGDVKNSIGSGEAKELTCMTHGHELRGGVAGGNGDNGWKGAKKENLGQL